MNSEEEESLKVLKAAIDYEFSLGKEGQPAIDLSSGKQVLA